MLNIAITGGIGTGKSTVTDHLISRGFTVIDADKMSREMTGPGGKAMPYILEHFDPDYIREDGSLDRAAMRDLVFSDPHYMKILEAGTTAVVLADIAKIREEKEAAGEKVMFYDIPLLFEKHQEGNYDLIWVVTADHDIRVERIMKRDGLDRNITDLMIGSQAEEETRLAGADLVIPNNGTVEELTAFIDEAVECICLNTK